jgi:hypothetical protein
MGLKVEVVDMKRLVLASLFSAAIALGVLSPSVRADDKSKTSENDPAKELLAIQNEWQKVQADYTQEAIKELQTAKTPEERNRLIKEKRAKRPQPTAFAERCLKLADAHPDSPVALEALAWVITNTSGSPAANTATTKLGQKLSAINDLDQLQKALAKVNSQGLGSIAPQVEEKARKNLDHPQAVPLLLWVCQTTLYGGGTELGKLYNRTVELLVDRFPERPEMAQLAGWLALDEDPGWAEKQLRRLVEKNPSAAVKAAATFGLAEVLKNKDESSQNEAEKLFARMAESTDPAHKGFVERAKNELKELQLHGLGKPVPEIAGDDLNGQSFKLSDYKGKVVLIDFWGFW